MNSCCLFAAALLFYSAAVKKAQSNNNATFTAAQASAGGNAYAQSCASCHGPNNDDGEFAPPLRGTAFLQKYAGKPVSELIDYITSRMPPGTPGSLGAR
jgi:mono/diheme cytochrome c family protein